MRDAPFDRSTWRPLLRGWCREQLGAVPRCVLFEDGWSGAVVGLVLVDGRRVVVKVRPWSDRLVACARVQAHLAAHGFPCPTPLVAPQPVEGLAFGAESYLPRPRLRDPGPGPMAAALHRLIALAPAARIEAPPWARPDHDGDGRWPATDGERDLADAVLPGWLARLTDQVRDRNRRMPDGVVGHADFEAQNLGADLTVYDFDSLATRPEAFHVGLAAAVWCAGEPGLSAATLAQSQAFLDAYETHRPFAAEERQLAWAAGLWVDCVNAAGELSAGRPGQAFATLEDEYVERARRANL